jgi:hypothetical protein
MGVYSTLGLFSSLNDLLNIETNFPYKYDNIIADHEKMIFSKFKGPTNF